MFLSADCGISKFPFYHLFYTASHGILVNVLLLILFLTAGMGVWMVCRAARSAWIGFGLLERDLLWSSWLVPDISVKPKGRAGSTSRAPDSMKSLLPEVQRKVRASHGQSVFQRVSGACRKG